MAAVAPFIPVILKFGGDLIDRLWPDKTAQAVERAAALQHMQDLAASQYTAQLQAAVSSDAAQAPVNLAEAQSPSFWKSGARPGILWVCAVALLSDFLVRPYVNAFAHVQIPALDWSELGPLLFGVLGLGAYRTVEKLKGVA